MTGARPSQRSRKHHAAASGLAQDAAALQLVERPFIDSDPAAPWPYHLHNLIREAVHEADATAELQQERIAAGRDKETLRQWKAFQRERGQARAAEFQRTGGYTNRPSTWGAR